jgi:acylphosphatase
MKTVHIIISGKVQGVFFRATAKKKALSLNLVGWVKNTVEGNVEIIGSGNPEDLENFIKWCKNGPENAKVDHVKVNQHDFQPFDSFEIIRNR